MQRETSRTWQHGCIMRQFRDRLREAGRGCPPHRVDLVLASAGSSAEDCATACSSPSHVRGTVILRLPRAVHDPVGRAVRDAGDNRVVPADGRAILLLVIIGIRGLDFTVAALAAGITIGITRDILEA